MRYTDFVDIMTASRMNRYLFACSGDTRKAMTLYRRNLQLSQEVFTIISCFEVALRNGIDKQCVNAIGNDWLKNGTIAGGIFDTANCRFTKQNIIEAVGKLHTYSHHKLVAELGFGFWRFMFAQHQFNATGRVLLKAFPSKPTSTPSIQYNNKYIFNQLAKLNDLRNRIAHHEPICFLSGLSVIDTTYTRQQYNITLQLFQWMEIDEAALLYGLDHIVSICDDIDRLR